MNVRSEAGFTLVELMAVVLIIGILVAVAVPMYQGSQATAAQRTCFANQRLIEGAAQMWVARDVGNDIAALAGDIDTTHPLVAEGVLTMQPRCPAAGASDPYVLDAAGTVGDCAFGSTGAHGHF